MTPGFPVLMDMSPTCLMMLGIDKAWAGHVLLVMYVSDTASFHVKISGA